MASIIPAAKYGAQLFAGAIDVRIELIHQSTALLQQILPMLRQEVTLKADTVDADPWQVLVITQHHTCDGQGIGRIRLVTRPTAAALALSCVLAPGTSKTVLPRSTKSCASCRP